MAHDVFISYSSRDKPAADAVCAGLERANIRCWVAPRDIAPGADWSASIMEAIGASRVLLLIFSGHADASRHVQREVQNACDQGLAIIPFRVEDVPPTGGMKYFLGTVHWLDALTPPMERHHAALVKVVEALLLLPGGSPGTIPARPAGPATPADPLPPTGPRRQRGPWLAVLAILLAVAAGISLYAGRGHLFPTPGLATPSPVPTPATTPAATPTPTSTAPPIDIPAVTPAAPSLPATTPPPADIPPPTPDLPQVQTPRVKPSRANAKARAVELMGLMKADDGERYTDYTYPTIIEAAGGRANFVAMGRAVRGQLTAASIKITSVEVGEPGEPVSRGDKSFIVVPTTTTFDSPTVTTISKGYLLGISTAGGEWKFIDGSVLTEASIPLYVPDLPATFKLPEKQPPTIRLKTR